MKLEKSIREDQQIQITAELDDALFEQFKQKAARKISQRAKIPGFRPGKAPYNVILRLYGNEAIEEQAKELLVDDIYPKVIDEAKIKPSGPGSLEKIESVHPPKFTFLIPLEPEVKLGDYHAIRLPYELPEVTEKDVDEYIHRLQTSYSTAEPVERPAEKGDLVYLKISGKLADPVENEDPIFLKETTSQALIGDGSFEENDFPFKGFANKLIGLSAGQEVEIKYSYPKDFESEKLKGKNVLFAVSVQSVKLMKLPELNDEFAKTVGNFDNFEAFKKTIRTQLELSKKQEYEKKYFDDLLQKIEDQSSIKFPPQMLEHEVEHALDSIKRDLAVQKLDLETYLKSVNKEKDKFIKEEVSPVAERQLRRSLVFEEIAHSENIQLEKDELNDAFNQAVQELQITSDFQRLQKKMAPKQLTNAIALQAANRLMNDHVLSRLKEIATGKFVEKQKDAAAPESESKPKKPVVKKVAAAQPSTEEKSPKAKTTKPKSASPKAEKKVVEK